MLAFDGRFGARFFAYRDVGMPWEAGMPGAARQGRRYAVGGRDAGSGAPGNVGRSGATYQRTTEVSVRIASVMIFDT